MSWGKRSVTGKTKKEDSWFSKAIRQRDDNHCRGCHGTSRLQCAHLYGRRTKSVRYHTMNAVCLCGDCHAYFTGEPIAWNEWCLDELGEDHMQALKLAWNLTLHTTEAVRNEISDHYRTAYNHMVKYNHHSLANWPGYYLLLAENA